MRAHHGWARSRGARPYQEDDLHTVSGGARDDLLVVLADGMGGHKGGAVASTLATRTFAGQFQLKPGSTGDRLAAGLAEANRAIAEEIRRRPDLRGMGCTLVGIAFTAEGVEWISVGDSPLWLYRQGRLERLNQDHSMTPVLDADVERGALSAEDARNHPQRHALRSAVIGAQIPLIDRPVAPRKPDAGDVFVIASDGVFTLAESEITEIIAATAGQPAQYAAECLVKAVESKNAAHQDNTTVIVVDFRQSAAAQDARKPSTRSLEGIGRRQSRRTRMLAIGVAAVAVASLAALAAHLGLEYLSPKAPPLDDSAAKQIEAPSATDPSGAGHDPGVASPPGQATQQPKSSDAPSTSGERANQGGNAVRRALEGSGAETTAGASRRAPATGKESLPAITPQPGLPPTAPLGAGAGPAKPGSPPSSSIAPGNTPGQPGNLPPQGVTTPAAPAKPAAPATGPPAVAPSAPAPQGATAPSPKSTPPAGSPHSATPERPAPVSGAGRRQDSKNCDPNPGAWERARSEGTREAVSEFLYQHPNSCHYDEAERLLPSLPRRQPNPASQNPSGKGGDGQAIDPNASRHN
ncbi:MAG: protein phosphatase 2C domain-containing protein [Alphaproteobacteria bacterium]|nr:protein phosphatase 2C domain-containing protein [Alphaproteobacteria bacterium]